MDAITLLKDDHRTAEALFRRYESGIGEKREIVEELIRELSIHAAIEEQVLYPAVRQAFPKGEDLAGEGIDEHQEVKETLSDLDGMDPGDPGFDQRVRSLIKDVRHHVEEEEEEMFPKLQQALSSERLEEMGSAMEAAKRTAPTRPHPMAPSTPPGNLVAGPVAGMVDRARDAVSGRSRKKTTAKKAAPKKPSATKKSTAKKSAAKKSTAKKSAAKKSTAKKSTAKKSTGRKSSAKSSARKSTARKTAAKRSAAKRAGGTTKGPVIHVTPATRGGWRAERAGSSRALASGDSKQEVVSKARDMAKRQRGRLVIHKANGRIQEERTYGPDPRRSKG